MKDMVMKMPTYASMFEELPTTVAKANALVAEVEHELQVKYSSLIVNNVRHDHALITITKDNNLLVLLYQFQCTKKQLPRTYVICIYQLSFVNEM